MLLFCSCHLLRLAICDGNLNVAYSAFLLRIPFEVSGPGQWHGLGLTSGGPGLECSMQGGPGLSCRLHSGRAGSPVAPPVCPLAAREGAAGMQLGGDGGGRIRIGSVDEGSLARDLPGAGRLHSS